MAAGGRLIILQLVGWQARPHPKRTYPYPIRTPFYLPDYRIWIKKMGFGYKKVGFRYNMGLDRHLVWYLIWDLLWGLVWDLVWDSLKKNSDLYNYKTMIGKYRTTQFLLINTRTATVYQNDEMILWSFKAFCIMGMAWYQSKQIVLFKSFSRNKKRMTHIKVSRINRPSRSIHNHSPIDFQPRFIHFV